MPKTYGATDVATAEPAPNTIKQNWGEPTSNHLRPVLEPIDEREKFQLAKWLLLGVAVMFTLGGLAHFSWPERGTTLFEACKTILPPIATLVIGYYFSEKAGSRAA